MNLLCAGAAQGLVKALQDAFFEATGEKVEGRFGAVGAMKEALLAGEPCDVMIVTASMVVALQADGRLVPGSEAALGRVRTGVAARSGEPLPAIATPEALKASLLAATAIYFPDAERSTAGVHFASVLARLRRVISRGSEVRTVITGTRLLARVDEQSSLPTSPFLQGFIPPTYLTPLMPEEGRALLTRGGFPPADVETMLERAACHPFLVQLIASRLFESRDLAVTLDQLAADEMVANYFAVDFNTLEQVERDALSEVAREGSGTRSALARTLGRPVEDLDAPLYGLTMLGYLARVGEGYKLANWFFERWLRRRVTVTR